MDMALNQPQHPLLIDTVMVNVLSYLPQKEFLSARLVCPIWDVNGRHLIKNDKGGFDFCVKMIDPKSSAIAVNGLRFAQFNTIFEDDSDGKKMVYSKFEIPDLVFSNDFRELWPSKIPVPPLALEPSVGRFFSKYGDKIKSLKLLLSNEMHGKKFQDYNCHKLENAARFMPNLEAIEFGETHYILGVKQIEAGANTDTTEFPEANPQIIPAKFNNVTRMKIRGHNVKLRNIPEYFPNIHWLSIDNPKNKLESILEKSFNSYWASPAPIPCHIEELTIETLFTRDLMILKGFNESRLKLKYFNGDAAHPGFHYNERFQHFYEFIRMQKNSLEKLEFKVLQRAIKLSFPLNWPSDSIIFPKLTSLGIRGEFIQQFCKGREFHKVFPSVEKIQLELPFIRKFQRNSKFGDLFPALTPSKVRILEISINGEHHSYQDQFGKMAQYFPDIQELSLIIKKYHNWDEYLITLLGMEEWIEKIKVLKISILKNDKFPIQIDGCLLDLNEIGYIRKFVQYIGSNLEEEEIEKEILGIAKFSNLTRLELSGPITITDISVYLGFGRMRSLKQIAINPPTKVELTSKCEEYVRKKGFQFLINQSPEIEEKWCDDPTGVDVYPQWDSEEEDSEDEEGEFNEEGDSEDNEEGDSEDEEEFIMDSGSDVPEEFLLDSDSDDDFLF